MGNISDWGNFFYYQSLCPFSNVLNKFLIFDWLAMEDEQNSDAVAESVDLVLNLGPVGMTGWWKERSDRQMKELESSDHKDKTVLSY